ncbi:MAG: flavin reductase family protein [Hyphomicrobiales bacterium]|nr:flavin reductase family protein [Hyphomicrobiales bacterium]
MFYEPHKRDKTILPHDPFKALIVPRPIGWVSTISREGAVNLAPYSFFNGVCDNPPMIAFASAGVKDSVAFAQETGEFVWNLATWDLRHAMNETSATLPRGENEFVHAGLEMAPSTIVKPPRVAKSPCAMECKVTQIEHLKDMHGAPAPYILVIGQIVGVHLDPAFVKDGFVQTAEMKPLARCGYLADYAVVDSLFQMERPE